VDSRWQLSLRYSGAIAALAIVALGWRPFSFVAGEEGRSVIVAQTSGPLHPLDGPMQNVG
jgi:hypothetical protein